jgi:hypothetical protein
MSLSDLVAGPGTRRSLPAMLNDLRAGGVERPPDSKLAELLERNVLPARPAAPPRWKQEVDAMVAEAKQQQAIDRAAMQEILARKRSEAAVFDPNKVDMRQQYEKTKRLDAALAQMTEDTNG